MAAMRVLSWPGMPAPEALARAGDALGVTVEADVVATNEAIAERLAAGERYDVVFPSDYLVERLRGRERIVPLEAGALPLERLEPWACDAVHDPGCRHSVPFAYGTTGYLHGEGLAGATTWAELFDPPPGVRVGMLDEIREVIGAALIVTGHDPNDIGDRALADARRALDRQRRAVARRDSDDFITPVVSGAVAAHHAWSGPAAAAAREHPGLRYVVPEEGALLWITTAAIPSDAPDPDRSLALMRELMDPDLAALTTARYGYATPNAEAKRRLPGELRADTALFPPDEVRERCHVARDLGSDERRLDEIWAAVA